MLSSVRWKHNTNSSFHHFLPQNFGLFRAKETRVDGAVEAEESPGDLEHKTHQPYLISLVLLSTSRSTDTQKSSGDKKGLNY